MDINSYRFKDNLTINELLNLEKVSAKDVFELLACTKELKTRLKFGEKITKNIGKNILFLTKSAFAKSRIAFEIATNSLSANPITISLNGSHLEEFVGSNESIKVIERFGISAVVVDTSDQNDAVTFSKNMHVPIINACERSGACHSLAALMTIWENKRSFDGLKAVIVGDLDGDKNSMLFGFAKCGIDTTVVAPEKTEAIATAIDYASQFVDVNFSSDVNSAIKGCDVIFAFEHDFGESFKLKFEQIEKLCNNACFMQNVPLTREKEADSELIDSENSLIYDFGENLMHATRSAIYMLSK